MIIPVIVPVFNRPEYTQVCLDSLYEADLSSGSYDGPPILPVIIDSGSRPRVQRMLQSWIDRHTSLPESKMKFVLKPVVIQIRRNRGFAAAVNQGLRLVICLPNDTPSVFVDEVVILHNDTVVFDGWIEEMFCCLRHDEDVAVAIPRTNYANEHGPCIGNIRAHFEKIKPNNKERILPEEILAVLEKTYPEGKQAVLDSIAEAEPRFSYIPEVASFCMMFRASLLKKYPWFDEDFFLRTFEDKLWFLPVERDGNIAMLANRAFVHHSGNATSDGPGYDFSAGTKLNEEKFREKVRIMDEKGATAPPKKDV